MWSWISFIAGICVGEALACGAVVLGHCLFEARIRMPKVQRTG